MRSIAIVLGDNDFGSMFRGLLETMVNFFIYHDGTKGITENNIRLLIKEGLRFHYLAYQTRWDMQVKEAKDQPLSGVHEKELQRVVDYLLYGNMPNKNYNHLRILFDNDADAAFNTEDHDGGAWHLDIKSGQINSF
jgi:hypothetical protein